MKQFLSFFICCSFALSVFAQDDPVVMRINGKEVTRSEFEYNYNKNNSESVVDKKSVADYVPLFVNYKLKIEAALDNHLDTLTSFQKEFRHYRDLQVRPLLVPQTAKEEECRKYYATIRASLMGKPLIKPAHIFLRVEQKADPSQLEKAKQRIDSIYNALQHGADFAQLAKTLSDDTRSGSRGGSLSWIGPNQTLKEFEDVAYSLEVGEMSRPFLSTVGFHIVKLEDKKEMESYEELRPKIMRYLEQQGLEEKLSEQVLDSLSHSQYQGKSVEQILDEETERLCQSDNDLKYLVQEYHDGLLLFEECTRQVWEPAKKDTVGIVTYFAAHRNDYAYDVPHYRGMMYYCREKADVKKVKASLKNVPYDQWSTHVRKQFNADSVMVRTERRIFARGENNNVDRYVFKVKGSAPVIQDGFPYVAYVGKVLKKGPEVWTDVKDKVTSDYMLMREQEYVEKLRQRYEVEVFDDVLQTVNQH